VRGSVVLDGGRKGVSCQRERRAVVASDVSLAETTDHECGLGRSETRERAITVSELVCRTEELDAALGRRTENR
jgi:hypothetical protein